MLYDLDWLQPGKKYPPTVEADRIQRYIENAKLFANEQFANDTGPFHNELYAACLNRICDTAGGTDLATVFPVVLNYQRAISLKTADLVCGESPSITGKTSEDTDAITDLREATDFDAKLYSTVLDLSRYGDAVLRVYKNEDTGKGDIALWNPTQWFPIVRDDGTLREYKQVICWKVNVGTVEAPVWHLRVQIHEVGKYEYREYNMTSEGTCIGELITSSMVRTGLSVNAVMHLRNIRTSDTVYGYDDYMPIDSLLAEILTRIAQISKILDAHASPSMVGPASMLTLNQDTGKKYLKAGKFFSVTGDDKDPHYLTWEGQLDAAFKELDELLKQLYMLSELGEALLGTMGSNGQAISGTAMRFKLANPLIKARRVANAMTLPVKKAIAAISELGYTKINAADISVEWEDGLPDDPREIAELAKLVTGATQLMPTEVAIAEYFDKTATESADWVRRIDEEKQHAMEMQITLTEQSTGAEGEEETTQIKENSRSVGSGKSSSFKQP